ncbi:diguanylate cyclase [Vibrio sp. SCSIO 43136]|uniref:sensor domain-containing diguanylate cyclase n=1 Tax=Vibrio sp. SCSIO 43136 TaxID=2819101 RepID=UPI0020761E7C|nr:diguanylate cyclase [Vibrio sp. SCSIO 43136]USD65662.1 diguanylate cyclase [Vibrio sp. SCSIO 43136]
MNKGSLVNRLLLTVALFAGLYLLIAASFLSVFYMDKAFDTVKETEEKLVLTVTNSASIAVFVDNPEIANEVMNALLLHDEFLGVRLRSIDEVVSFSASKASNQPQPSQPATQYPLYSPIDASVIGYLELDINQGYIDELTQKQVMIQLVVLSVQIMVLVFALVFAARHIVGFPLQSLAKNLAKVKPGKAEKLPIRGDNQQDEVNLVTQSINHFVESSAKALETERELRSTIEKMEQHYRHIFDTTQVGILVLDENGCLIHKNPTLFGRLIQESYELLALLESQPFFKLVFDDPDAAWALSEQAMSSGDVAAGDLRINKKYHPEQWVHILLSAYRDDKTGEWFIEGIMYDITARVQREQDTLSLAIEDRLTGLSNRLGCERYITQVLEQYQQGAVVVMLIDLDGFKPVNDQYGHAAGDKVLQAIAGRLLNLPLDMGHQVGRLGGDELLVMMVVEQYDKQQMQWIAQKIVQVCSEPISVSSEVSVRVTCSVGISHSLVESATFEQLVGDADEAMYYVKENGRNGVCHYAQLGS